MKEAVLICDQEKARDFFEKFLSSSGYKNLKVIENAQAARQHMIENDPDIVIINSPLATEFGQDLAGDISANITGSVILYTKTEYLSEIRESLKYEGVITLGKPIHTGELLDALYFCEVANARMEKRMLEAKKLKKKLGELKLVNRAKLLLMEYAGMKEDEAHKKIERNAMDFRKSKSEIAKEIIESYEGVK